MSLSHDHQPAAVSSCIACAGLDEYQGNVVERPVTRVLAEARGCFESSSLGGRAERWLGPGCPLRFAKSAEWDVVEE